MECAVTEQELRDAHLGNSSSTVTMREGFLTVPAVDAVPESARANIVVRP